MQIKTGPTCRKDQPSWKTKIKKETSSLQPNSVHYSSAVPLHLEVSVWVIMGSSMHIQYKRSSHSLTQCNYFPRKTGTPPPPARRGLDELHRLLGVARHWETNKSHTNWDLGEGSTKIYVSSQTTLFSSLYSHYNIFTFYTCWLFWCMNFCSVPRLLKVGQVHIHDGTVVCDNLQWEPARWTRIFSQLARSNQKQCFNTSGFLSNPKNTLILYLLASCRFLEKCTGNWQPI